MKQITLIILALAVSINIMAQENVKQREVGISLAGLEEFGFTFKTGTEKALWRFNTLIISGYNSEQIEESFTYERNIHEIGISFGKEYRKEIAKNLEFRFGADVSFSYKYYKLNENYTSEDSKMSSHNTFIPGLNLVFGLNYIINSNFIIGAELLPGINYYITKYDEINSSYFKPNVSMLVYELSNSYALLSFAYRF